MECPDCAAILPEDAVRCQKCGAPSSNAATILRNIEPRVSTNKVETPSNRSNDNRFPAGTILVKRYRILGPLGQGGMGEVYRADDLKLGHPVALKFLPPSVSGDGAALARFHREVRTARNISHSNICRVFDIVEAGEFHFIAMEYVDGEDLASLLRRIGRLPAEKAIELSRQICAGLSAAHENGVLHRDLKPANIMIDGRGKARIADFGLSGAAYELQQDEITAGTPAYMAPEQLTGKEVTTKSDIYSLGQVLYELFTGKRAFDASTLNELIRLKEQSAPTNPSTYVKEIDPATEKIILRCLERDPQKRPDSALQVAAALPGGDPLAAALAAGETPSPEMVAAASVKGSITPKHALFLLLGTVLLFALYVVLGQGETLYRIVRQVKSPEILIDRSAEILNRLGYIEQPADSAYGWSYNLEFLEFLKEKGLITKSWNKIASGNPPALLFWYRQSRRDLIAARSFFILQTDPIPETPGTLLLLLDAEGRLSSLRFSPAEKDLTTRPQNPVEWPILFREAGLNPELFQPVETSWTPPVINDEKSTWRGAFENWPDVPIDIHAAWYQGRPVYFEISGPWKKPAVESKGPAKALSVVLFSLLFGALAIGSYFAYRNLRMGRCDRVGAFRITLFIFVCRMLQWLFGTHHVNALDELTLLLRGLQSALFWSCLVGVLYLALEPVMRRRRPEWIISWNRLLMGGWKDPLVGRDILFGAFFGAVFAIAFVVAQILPGWFGRPPNLPSFPAHELSFFGITGFLTVLMDQITASLVQGFLWTFLVLFWIILLRDQKRGSIVGALSLSLLGLMATLQLDPISWSMGALAGFVVGWVIIRYGLLAVITTLTFIHLIIFFSFTTDLSAWYAPYFVFDALLLFALLLYSFRISTARQRLFAKSLLDE